MSETPDQAPDQAPAPVPLRQIAADLATRAELLAGEVTSAHDRLRNPPPPPPQTPAQRDASAAAERRAAADFARTHPGTPEKYRHALKDGLGPGPGEVQALRQDLALRSARKAASSVQQALEWTPPESLPDDPADLDGPPIAQALLAARMLESLDAERDADGHLTTPAAKKAFAQWAQRRDDLDGPVREHLDGLHQALAEAADTAAPYLLPDPGETPAPVPERTTSSWV